MGRDKALLDWHGAPLGARVARRLCAAVAPGPVVVVGQSDFLAGFGSPEIRVVADSVAGQGPLQGLRDGLAALASEVHVAFVTTVDAPFLEPGLVEAVVAGLGDKDAAVPSAAGRRHPLTAAYRVSTFAVAEAALGEGVRRVLDFIDRIDVRYVEEPVLRAVDHDLRSLVNVNTPEEYEAALRLA